MQRSMIRSVFAVFAAFALLASGAHADAPSASTSASPSTSAPAAPVTLKIAAASDLAFAFQDIAAAFEKKTGTKVTLSMGSTGQFARQLVEGAPFDVFAAANVSFVDDTVKAGVCDGATKSLYGQGRIVLWSNRAFGFVAPTDVAALVDKKYVKVAIANPEHAPYGKAAQEAMTKAGVWDTVKPKLVYGENIQQTLKLAQSGNAEVAIVALSLALGAKDGDYRAIDAKLHNEINQALVVCGKNAERTKAARAFVDYVGSPEGRATMKRFGFLLPGES